MTDAELIVYYKNLLILQYNQLDKASEHIEAIVKQIIIFELIEDVKNGYDIDTAVGVQLDIIGKYLGLERTTFIAIDADYRFYLKFKLVQIFSNYSAKEIDDLLYEFFTTNIYLTDNFDMTIKYTFVSPDIDQVNFLLENNLIPKPAAVGFSVIGTSGTPFVFFGDSDGLGYGYLVHAAALQDLKVDFGAGQVQLQVNFGAGLLDLQVDFGDGAYMNSGQGGEYSYLLKPE